MLLAICKPAWNTKEHEKMLTIQRENLALITESPQPTRLSSATSLLEWPDFMTSHEECLYVQSKGMSHLKSPPIQLLNLGRSNGGNVVERWEWVEGKERKPLKGL